MLVPLIAVLQVHQRRHAFRVDHVPTGSRNLQATRARPTAGLCRAAPDLQAIRNELRILNHPSAIRHIIQQLRRRLATATTQRRFPLAQARDRRVVSRVLEPVQPGTDPLIANTDDSPNTARLAACTCSLKW